VSRQAPTTAGSRTKVAQALYEAINRHDFDAGFALLDPGFEWIEPEQALLLEVFPAREDAERAAAKRAR